MSAHHHIRSLLTRCDTQLQATREVPRDQLQRRIQHDDLTLIADLKSFLDEDDEQEVEDSATSGSHGGTPDEEEGREGLETEEHDIE